MTFLVVLLLTPIAASVFSSGLEEIENCHLSLSSASIGRSLQRALLA